jgi:hypothetical protein
LRLRRTQQRAGLHVELFHLHMCGQRVAGDGVIGQAREIGAEMALDERAHEARLQSVAGGIGGSATARCTAAAAATVVFDTRVEGIEQTVRLAQRQRRADAQWPWMLPAATPRRRRGRSRDGAWCPVVWGSRHYSMSP